MASRLRITGVILLVIGLVSLVAGGYAYLKVQNGAAALQGFSAAQAVALTYNDEGQLVDRGTTEGADAIMALLRDDWKWPVEQGELDPNDPLVNTATEYMYQMATIAYHTLHGTQTVMLTEPVEYDADGDGVVAADAPSTPRPPSGTPAKARQDAVFQPGTYVVPSTGGTTTSLTALTRSRARSASRPGVASCMAFSPSSASAPPPHRRLQLGLGVAGGAAAVGLAFVILGGGLIWAGMAKEPERVAVA